MKKIVVQVQIELDNNIPSGKRTFKFERDLYKLSRQQAEKYAEKYDADYFAITDLNYLPNKHPVYQKFKIYDLDYDQILYVDSDVILFDHAPDIFKFKEHDFAAVLDNDWSNPNNQKRLIALRKRFNSSDAYMPFCSGLMLTNQNFLNATRNNVIKYITKYEKQFTDQEVFNQLVVDYDENYLHLNNDWGTWYGKGVYAEHICTSKRRKGFNLEKFMEQNKLGWLS